MPTIEELLSLPVKIMKRSEYIKGKGYNVRVRTTYTRVRRVRALNEEDALNFAMVREAQYAPRYFKGQNHMDYVVESIEAVEVSEVVSEDDDVVSNE